MTAIEGVKVNVCFGPWMPMDELGCTKDASDVKQCVSCLK